MSKRKNKTARYVCEHCGSSTSPERAITRTGFRCQRCPDCRGLITT